MPIDYRYHIGSLVAVFLALLLGILIGIGLVGNPQELDKMVSDLKEDYLQVSETKDARIAELSAAANESAMLARETVAAIIAGRLQGKGIAIVVDHEFGNDRTPDNLRGTLTAAGARVISLTTFTRSFVALPLKTKEKVEEQTDLVVPQGTYVRTAIAEAIGRDLARGRTDFIAELQSIGLVKTAADSDYSSRPDAVLVIGGAGDPQDIAPERIDLPLVRKLTELGVRVVGVEAKDAAVSVVALYKAAGVATVDNADTAAGRLSTVLLLANREDGHYGVKDTADSFVAPIPQSPLP